MNNAALIAWLIDAGTVIALALLAAAFAYGLLLLLIPRAALKASAALNRRYSSRKAMRPLEIPHRSEGWFYRRHRSIGVLLATGVAVFFLLYFFHYPDATLLQAAARRAGVLAPPLVDALTLFLLVANAFVGAFALVMIVRPSLLKPVEAWANRWVSTRQALRGADQSYEPVDRFFARHPRWAGMLILLGASYVVLSFLVIAKQI